jgi:hypothetical protein
MTCEAWEQLGEAVREMNELEQKIKHDRENDDSKTKPVLDIQISQRALKNLDEKGMTRYRRKGYPFNAIAWSKQIDVVGYARDDKHRILVLPEHAMNGLIRTGSVTTASDKALYHVYVWPVKK